MSESGLMSVTDRVPRRAIARFLLIFATTFALLQVSFLQAEGTRLERWLIGVGTVRAAATIIDFVDPIAGVRADGSRIVSDRARLNVLRGCEGTELYFLWIAAVLAFPAPWTARLSGLAVGLGAAWLLNQVRVVALFLAIRDYPQWFPLLHGYIAPALVVLLLVVCFGTYVRHSRAL